jgi:hypothetical protein
MNSGAAARFSSPGTAGSAAAGHRATRARRHQRENLPRVASPQYHHTRRRRYAQSSRRRLGRHSRMGSCWQGRRDYAGQGQGGPACLHARRTGCHPQRRQHPRLDRRAGCLQSGRDNPRCLPEQYRLWRNIPASVWEYSIGGYQVIKKWLSYREHALLGRALTTDEAREVTHMARRIAAIVLLYPALGANYLAVKQAPIPWTSLSKNG